MLCVLADCMCTELPQTGYLLGSRGTYTGGIASPNLCVEQQV